LWLACARLVKLITSAELLIQTALAFKKVDIGKWKMLALAVSSSVVNPV
jgi:hypothetical protein